jgi:hypothetical protein
MYLQLNVLYIQTVRSEVLSVRVAQKNIMRLSKSEFHSRSTVLFILFPALAR